MQDIGPRWLRSGVAQPLARPFRQEIVVILRVAGDQSSPS
jgi:hypothetical protein